VVGLGWLAAVAVGVGVAAQAVTGFGFSLISAPFLVAAYRAPAGVRLNLLLSLAVNVVILAREHRHADGRAAGLLLVSALVAIVPSAYVVHRVGAGPLTVAAGLVCLLAVGAVAAGRVPRRGRGRAGAALVGFVSGAMNVIAGISGPPVVLYAVNAEWPLERTRPTMQLFFLGLNILSLAALGVPRRIPAALVVGFAAGWLTAYSLGRRPSGVTVRRATLILAAAGSAMAIVRGLTI
jgi:uncharacterized membrane protein YfcA